jgi:hypothetical protein
MKRFIFSALAAGLLVGCASTDSTTVTHRSGSTVTTIEDQPQTAIAGQGSLMPGAYETRNLPTGQFTGRERTNDQIGQRPTLPREADARDLARSEESLGVSGTGTLGQSGVTPDRPVTSETLLESAQGSAPGQSSDASAGTNDPVDTIIEPPTSGPRFESFPRPE